MSLLAKLETLRLRGTILACRAWLRARPRHYRVLVELARAERQAGQRQAALRTLHRAEAVRPSGLATPPARGDGTRREAANGAAPSTLHLEELARGLAWSERFPEAIAAYQAALERDPTRAAALLQLAKLLRHTGQCSAALDAVLAAHRLRPDHRPTQRFHRVLSGDDAVYRQHWRPTVTPTPGHRGEPGRILHLLENSLPHRHSGYTIRSHYILCQQRACGLDPVALTRAGFPWDMGATAVAGSDTVDGIDYHRIEFPGQGDYNHHPLDRWLATYAEGAARVAERVRPSLLHAASNFKNALAARALADAHDLPWVYELRGLWEDTLVSKGVVGEQSERYRYFRALEDECLQAADAVVTLSQTLRESLVERGIAPEKIFVVPNGVDTEVFARRDARDPALVAALGLGPGPVFGYVSSLAPYEGLDVLLRAFVEIRRAVPTARLLVVGDGEERTRLERLSLSLGIADATTFTGRVPHDRVPDHYSVIDVFVVPRLPHRVCELVPPLKPCEAMATGRAMLMSDVRALRELVEEGRTGMLFRAGDADDLARAGIALASDPALRAALGAGAAEWVRANRRWADLVPVYHQAYAHARAAHAARRGAVTET
ncbi:MAG: glycosyltransferase [Ectothiorhodospiraceae bacterium]|nr:glycosyltransferase [Ectothiorhodospiraceae bacterium]